MNLRTRIELAHREAARVVGMMSLSLTKTSIRPEIIRQWAAGLRRAADILEENKDG